MRVSIIIAVLSLLMHGCLLHDDDSTAKNRVAPGPLWEKHESSRVRQEAESLQGSCRALGAWVSHGAYKDLLVKYINWTGDVVTKDRTPTPVPRAFEAHHYVHETIRSELKEGQPNCRLDIWIDSLAIEYVKHHNVRCALAHTDKNNKVFFKMMFHNEIDLTFKRKDSDPYADCEDELLFFSGNADGSLTIVTGTGKGDSGVPFRSGKVFSANEDGELPKDQQVEEITISSSSLVTYQLQEHR
ncbi:MAG: hypothetical protein OYH77_00495 [Pseudomonadota bacterium]|nr:hypothetical protein [Pseudomonadota bacterium]